MGEKERVTRYDYLVIDAGSVRCAIPGRDGDASPSRVVRQAQRLEA